MTKTLTAQVRQMLRDSSAVQQWAPMYTNKYDTCRTVKGYYTYDLNEQDLALLAKAISDIAPTAVIKITRGKNLPENLPENVMVIDSKSWSSIIVRLPLVD